MIHLRPNVEAEAVYTVGQTAQILGVERHTVYRYFGSGVLKYRRRKADGRLVTKGEWITECWEELYI